MDASKTIERQAQELRAMWRETWWAMAGGTKSEFDKIKATEVMEFWAIFDLWKKKTTRERDAIKELKAKRKKQ